MQSETVGKILDFLHVTLWMNVKAGDVSKAQIRLAENLKGKDFADLLHEKITVELSDCKENFDQGYTSKANYHWPLMMIHWRWIALDDVWVENDETRQPDKDEIP